MQSRSGEPEGELRRLTALAGKLERTGNRRNLNRSIGSGWATWVQVQTRYIPARSNTGRSLQRLMRMRGRISGADGIHLRTLKTYVPEMVELLIDCVRNPVFLDWEVNEQLLKVKAEIAEASNNPQGLLLEASHSAGYSGALGNPLLTSESAISRLDSTILEEFVAENYTAARMVLVAAGVEHEELMKIAEPLLSDLPSMYNNTGIFGIHATTRRER